jgi:hypothetical protein
MARMRRRLHLIVLLPALLALLVVPASPAGAQTPVLDQAAQALRRNPVYVDPSAERGREVSADTVQRRIASGGSPIFVAVLPSAAVTEAGGDASRLPSVLGQKVGLQGTYAVVAGNSFRAASNVLPAGRAGALATSTFQAESGNGTQAVLNEFVDRVNQAATGSGGGGSSGGGGGSATGLLVLLALGGGGLFLWSRRRGQQRRQEVRRATAGDRQMLQAELSVLGDDVLALEPQVTMHPDARADYDAGVTRYRSATAAMEYADDEVDLVRVRRVVDEGRYAMARARALVDGREPPAPPEELRRPGSRDEPALDVDERGTPVYVGYGGMPWYGGGWFGGGGGLLTGLMLGQMLGGGWGGGWGGGGLFGGGYGGGYDRGEGGDGGWEGGGDGGDWGGDAGGGDFGGGDFGGDAGGGDW